MCELLLLNLRMILPYDNLCIYDSAFYFWVSPCLTYLSFSLNFSQASSLYHPFSFSLSLFPLFLSFPSLSHLFSIMLSLCLCPFSLSWSVFLFLSPPSRFTMSHADPCSLHYLPLVPSSFLLAPAIAGEIARVQTKERHGSRAQKNNKDKAEKGKEVRDNAHQTRIPRSTRGDSSFYFYLYAALMVCVSFSLSLFPINPYHSKRHLGSREHDMLMSLLTSSYFFASVELI